MSKPQQGLLKQEDFVELKYQVIVKNSTTKTEVHTSVQVTITELRDRGVVLRLPSGACMLGHVLLLQILPKTNLAPKPAATQAPATTQKIAPIRKTEAAIAREREQLAREKERAQRDFQAKVVEITAKVQLVQITDDGSLHVELAFYQFNEKKWQEFMKAFAERQDNIHRIVKAVKG